MRIKHKITAAAGLLGALVFKKKAPLIVGWELTNRCNKRCGYCRIWDNKTVELDTGVVFSIIDQLAKCGTQAVNLTGGEPLLRDDIGTIIDCLAKKNIYVRLNSNGALFPGRLRELRKLDEVKLSLEGTEQNHDIIRGANSYREVITAANLARDNGIRITFNTVLTKYNLGDIDFVLYTARMFGARVTFQPATQWILGTNEINPFVPEDDRYKKTINTLRIKKKKNENIRNSMVCLGHLYSWPQPRAVLCNGRLISCRISANGDVMSCSHYRQHSKSVNTEVNSAVVDFKTAFNMLPALNCNNCWCADRIEANCLVSLNLNSIWNALYL
ncbi:MAG: radical SAM protein [Candidatus Omnitrophica bacterium]|nr:radical SAM protein [Candidatus Omnitrophota bacterium]MBU1924633.1 radical SAM protein [Candidatus Omnitrophota bacterium]